MVSLAGQYEASLLNSQARLPSGSFYQTGKPVDGDVLFETASFDQPQAARLRFALQSPVGDCAGALVLPG